MIIRQISPGRIIAITGSCGKTSLKEMLGRTLSKFGKTVYSQKSFNNKYGVPVSLFNLDQNHEFGVFEVGMDKKGEINELSNLISPDLAIITNVAYAHAKNFKNIKEIALAKAEIIYNIKKGGSLVLNNDDKFYDLHKQIAFKNNIKVRSFSIKNKSADISLSYIKKDGANFKMFINNKNKFFVIPNNFESDIRNILATITAISIFKNINDLDKEIFYDIKKPNGRGDISKIKIDNKNINLIDESYNSNPLSLKSAIENYDKIKIIGNKKYMILGDMLELGSHSKKLHFEMSKVINSSSLENVSVIGKDIKETYKNIFNRKKGLILKETSEIIDLIKNHLDNNDYLMIKGSNSTGLNKLIYSLKRSKTNAL